MASEELYGRQGTEAAMGYQPMPEIPAEPTADLGRDEAVVRINERARPAPTVERDYFQVDGDDVGKRQPDNKSVELDRAARDLKDSREAEAAIAEAERNQQLAAEIDAARRHGEGQSVLAQEAQQPEAPHRELQQPQGSEIDPNIVEALKNDPNALAAIKQHVEGLKGLIDPEVAAALKNPKVLSAIQQQRAADVESLERFFDNGTNWARQNASIAVSAFFNLPELQGIPLQQMPGALAVIAKQSPERHAQIMRQLDGLRVANEQAERAIQGQRQWEGIKFQEKFQEFSKAQDRAFEDYVANESPENVRAAKQEVYAMLREAGASDADIQQTWNSNEIMRSAWGQRIMYDAARYRLAKATAANKIAPKPVPYVNRPGSSVDRPAAAERDALALEQRFGGPKAALSVKDAAALTIARRARAR